MAKKLLITAMAFIIAVSMIELVAVPIGGVDFYVAKDGEECTEFVRGDKVYLRARSAETKVIDVQVELIFPAGSGKTPIVVVPRTTKAILGYVLIYTYQIQANDPIGTYSFRITVWDTSTGNLLEQKDITFIVKETGIPWMYFLIPAAIIIIAVAGAVILLRKPKKAVPSPPPETEIARGIEGPVGGLISGETLAITTPEGGTLTIVAQLQLGPGNVIPITQLPQTFGRKDFKGKVSDEVLRAISRRHFTIDYDYSTGTFVIIDENSTNGTFVNGVDIRGRGRHPLRNGDTINIAGLVNVKFIAAPVTA